MVASANWSPVNLQSASPSPFQIQFFQSVKRQLLISSQPKLMGGHGEGVGQTVWSAMCVLECFKTEEANEHGAKWRKKAAFGFFPVFPTKENVTIIKKTALYAAINMKTHFNCYLLVLLSLYYFHIVAGTPSSLVRLTGWEIHTRNKLRAVYFVPQNFNLKVLGLAGHH